MNIVSLPHPNRYLIVEPLDYPNPYDYKTPHRHDYFEIIFINRGGGRQLIDFTQSQLEQQTIYMIYPRQIHLLERGNAEGLIIQFKKEIFEWLFPLQHHFLYFNQADIHLAEADFQHLYQVAQNILVLNNSKHLSPLSIYKSYSYLQIVLITLIESHRDKAIGSNSSFAGHFLQLISHHIRDKRKVADYAEMMHISADKLSLQCKEALGTTPLKLIHEELLLEIKRLMILDKLSLKEIAYELNFDSTANFSSFIKAATNYTPGELQDSLKKNVQ